MRRGRAWHHGETLPICRTASLGIELESACRTARTRLVTAHAVGDDPGCAFPGFRGRRSVLLLRCAYFRGDIAVEALVALGGGGAARDATVGESALGASTILFADRRALAVAVAVGRGCVRLAVSTARGRRALVARTYLTACSVAITGAVIATRVGGCFVGTETVWILATDHGSADPIFFACEGARAGIAASTGCVAADAIDTALARALRVRLADGTVVSAIAGGRPAAG